jgi:hypothetical protein
MTEHLSHGMEFSESARDNICTPSSSISDKTSTCCELLVGFGPGRDRNIRKCLICFGKGRYHSYMLQFLILVRESGDEENRLENGGLYSPA